ncbi:hypothetical protein Q9L58_000352 [Maublancomyces gigas]|uniref:Xylanolytic transcriptional activator regulatory domain-containing protein n=1 Tax=Discina gigas TaxID=1032678 RepID=A0ABR3GXL0_9PEZI
MDVSVSVSASASASPSPAPASAPARPELQYTRFRACNECRRRRASPALRETTRTRTRSIADHLPTPDKILDLDQRLGRIERAVKQHLAARRRPPPAPAASSSERALVGPLGPSSSKRALYVWKVSSEQSSALSSGGGLIRDSEGQIKFIGESSVFSIFLPHGMQWIIEKVGKMHFYDPLARTGALGPYANPLENVLEDVPGCRSLSNNVETTLPARHVVRKYVNDYFDRVNCATPIFDRETFDAELCTFYQPGSRPSAAWMLAFYMILALGCISEPREESVVLRTANQAEALSFFHAGSRLIPAVLFCNRDICGVQALLATVLFLWETPSTNGCFTMIGIVVSIGTEIGLHRCGTQLGLNPRDVDLRRNVFWVAYNIDKEVAIRVGRAPSIPDSDITVKLPRADIAGCTPRVLLHRVQLAKIQSEVSRMLCLSANTTHSDETLLDTVGSLRAELERWRDACEMMREEALQGPEIPVLQALWLRLTYFSCLGAITRPLSPVFEGGRLLEGFETPIFAARETVRLIDTFEQRGLKLFRSTAIQLVAAVVTLFTNILDSPLSQSATEDLAYVHRVVEHLRLGTKVGCPGVNGVFLPTDTLYHMAAQTVERVRRGEVVEGREVYSYRGCLESG